MKLSLWDGCDDHWKINSSVKTEVGRRVGLQYGLDDLFEDEYQGDWEFALKDALIK